MAPALKNLTRKSLLSSIHHSPAPLQIPTLNMKVKCKFFHFQKHYHLKGDPSASALATRFSVQVPRVVAKKINRRGLSSHHASAADRWHFGAILLKISKNAPFIR